MFYGYTVAAIRAMLASQGLYDHGGKMIRGLDITLETNCNLVATEIYAFCNHIEGLDTTVAANASIASFQIGFVAALSEVFFGANSFMLGANLSQDTKMGFDRPHQRPVIGFDFGRTICDIGARHITTGRAEVDPQFFDFPFVDGALETIKGLVPFFGPQSMHIISKCAPESEEPIREWLVRKDFWRLTGMRPDNIYFCRERAKKAGICKERGITHFVDDRREVLAPMTDMWARIALNPRDDDDDEKPFINGEVIDPLIRHTHPPMLVAKTWQAVGDLIAATFRRINHLMTL